jgi:hypothetical protein
VGNADGHGIEAVDYVPYQMGTDFQFQRRSGSHLVDGVSVTTTTDLVFAGAHSDASKSDGGIEVIDITDPSSPTTLTRIPCPGYQSDVAVHETLLLQAIDHPASNAGCDPDWLAASGSAAVDRPGIGGVRIFDVSDPARPRLLHFVEVGDEFEAVHNLAVLPWADVAYLAQLNGELGILDLGDGEYPYTALEVSSISPEMKTSCHDIGLDPVKQLAFCPASLDETYVLDVSDPMGPAYLSTIVNAALSRHHEARMAPDGVTLVLQAEYDHPPEVASDAPAGVWFYDFSDPTDPQLLGSWAPDSCEPSERDERACSSHSFNFIPGTELLVASWRHEGVFVVDYADPAHPVEAGAFRPGGRGILGLGASAPDFWAAYYWHGHLYANAGRGLGGLYILRHDESTTAEPSPYDEGMVWGRWSADGR